MIVRFGSVSAEKYVAIVVHGRHLDSRASKQFVGVSARRAPHGIEHHPQVCFSNDLEIDNLAKPFQVCGLWIERSGRSRLRSRPWQTAALSPATISASIFFVTSGKSRTSVGRGKLDSVIFRRIVRRGEIDHSIRLVVDYGVAKCRESERARATTSGVIPCADKISAAIEQNVSPEKTRIASHDDASALSAFAKPRSGRFR